LGDFFEKNAANIIGRFRGSKKLRQTLKKYRPSGEIAPKLVTLVRSEQAFSKNNSMAFLTLKI
jgi:hypothetical protein